MSDTTNNTSYLIATIGLRPLIGMGSIKFTQATLKQAINTPKVILNYTDKIVQGESLPTESVVTSDIAVSDVEAIKKHLAGLDPTTYLQEVIPKLEREEDVGVEVGAAISDILAKLLAKMPPLKDAAFSDDVRFMWLLRIIDNPLIILALLDNQSLVKKDIDAIKDLYPQIFDNITAGMMTAFISHYKPGDSVPRRLKRMFSTLYETPLLDDKTLSAYIKQEDRPQSNLNMPKTEADNTNKETA